MDDLISPLERSFEEDDQAEGSSSNGNGKQKEEPIPDSKLAPELQVT
jgi:hypothetical protein